MSEPQLLKHSTVTFRRPVLNSAVKSSNELYAPAVCGGEVNIRRFQVTVEEIPEPHEVLCERLQYLWEHSCNVEDTLPIQMEAKKIGYILRGNRGDAFKSFRKER